MSRSKKETLEEQIFTSAAVDKAYGVIPSEEAAVIVTKLKPSFGDPGWSDYVIAQLTKDERGENGHPKTEGLRRIAGLLLGPIVESRSEVLVHPSFDNMLQVVCSHTLRFRLDSPDNGPEERVFTAVAEASPHNLAAPFDRSPAAIASTKALGRALRDALQLKNIIVAEESSSEVTDEDAANATQIRGVLQQSAKLGIDPLKLINHTGEVSQFIFKRVEEMDRTTATQTLKDLHRYGTDRESIPAEFKL